MTIGSGAGQRSEETEQDQQPPSWRSTPLGECAGLRFVDADLDHNGQRLLLFFEGAFSAFGYDLSDGIPEVDKDLKADQHLQDDDLRSLAVRAGCPAEVLEAARKKARDQAAADLLEACGNLETAFEAVAALDPHAAARIARRMAGKDRSGQDLEERTSS